MKGSFVSIFALISLVGLTLSSCKQKSLKVAKYENVKKEVYLADASKDSMGLIPVFEKKNFTIDNSSKTINVSIPVYRNGFEDTDPFTIDISVDNSMVDQLVDEGKLPFNTIPLGSEDYLLATQDTLIMQPDHLVGGEIVPKIKVKALEKYVGKVVALGIQVTNTSKYSVNKDKNIVVFYFPVDKILGKVYFSAAEFHPTPLLSVLKDYTFDSTANTIDYSTIINRIGLADFGDFPLNISVDNQVVTELINSGKLPSNTITLSPDDYTLNNPVILSHKNGEMQGELTTTFKVSKMLPYSGKKAALGLTVSKSSKFEVRDNMHAVVLYFDVDSLLDQTLPPKNLIVPSDWKVLNIARNNNIQIAFSSDSSKITFTGGNGGHMAVYQKVEVKGNQSYKIDMDVKGSGATDTWFEAYVSPTVPQQGKDYTTGKLVSLNTWSGCGNTPFNGLLSKLNCAGPGNVISFPNAGDVYVVIKSGGANLGTTGITIADIVFKRIQ